jgi:hypothetical protein
MPPTGVTRGSSLILKSGPEASFSALERRLTCRGVGVHRPELHHPEGLLTEPDPLVPVEDRAARAELDRRGDREPGGGAAITITSVETTMSNTRVSAHSQPASTGGRSSKSGARSPGCIPRA